MYTEVKTSWISHEILEIKRALTNSPVVRTANDELQINKECVRRHAETKG